jgi:hypothetical protein
MSQRVLTLAVLRPASDDFLDNRLTAVVSQHGVCHAELVFDNGVAFSIYQGGVTSLRRRTLSNPNYETVTLSVSAAEYAACLQFCNHSHRQQYAFDKVGMYFALLHPPCFRRSSAAVGRTFCSKIIAEALQFAGVTEADGLVPSSSTPSSLYARFIASPRRICHSLRLPSLRVLAPPQPP